MGVLEVGITALNAFRTQLTTTSHNVANVNTEGYTRQIADLGTLPPNVQGGQYIGSGVRVEQVKRQFDQFLVDRVRQYTATDEESQIYLSRAQRVDNIIADPDAGLSVALQDFFNSVQDVADDPSSVTTRDVLLSNANILTDRFHSVFEFMESMRSEVNQDMEVLVQEANKIAESIADINSAIQTASASLGGSQPNDLLDKRDQLINNLSELVAVKTVAQSDGAVNVYIGNGQALVVGTENYTLGTQINDAEPDRLDIILKGSGGVGNVVTQSLSGGMLGGFLKFRQEVLDPAENALGRLATGLAYAFNEQHELGMDLNGDLGGKFFVIPNPDPAENNADQSYLDQMLLEVTNTNSRTIYVEAIDPGQLSTSDYELKYDGTDWVLRNRETQSSQTVTPNGSNQIIFDGVTVNIGAAAYANGDLFVIRPTRLASRAFEMAIGDARQIAAASPVAIEQEATNTGSAKIVNDVLQKPLTTATLASFDVELTYSSGTGLLSVSSSTPAGSSIATDPGVVNGYILSIQGLGDLKFQLSGAAANGDIFSFSRDITDPVPVGDNRNMLQLADLRSAKTMREDSNGNGTSNFTNLYSSLIGDVGSKTRQAMINNATQQRLREQSETAFDEVSGVNLDEEAANLVHFQQAYQAASQVIRVSNQLFDSLLNAIG
jgi:flagellar hook-associated protein 1 FlgK